MKWIVFALGFVLAAGGIAAISQGYDIVQVERGWTLVIAGTVALGSGIVTIALGVVAARIDALLAWSAKKPDPAADELGFPSRDEASAPFAAAARDYPAAAPAPAPFADVTAEEQAALASIEPPPPVAAAAGVADLATSEIGGNRQPLKDEPASFKSPNFRRWRSKPADEISAPGPVLPAPSMAAPARVRPRATFRPPPMPAKSVPPPGIWPAEPADSGSATGFSGEAKATPSAAEPSMRVEAELAGDKKEYDWLEMALAGSESHEIAKPKPGIEEGEAAATTGADEHAPLMAEPAAFFTGTRETNEREKSDNAPAAAPPHAAEIIPLQTPEPVSGPAIADDMAAGASDEHTIEPAAARAPREEPKAAAVVGRYESNGASYVLFADGTIEAATPSGVYRFGSMAELKTFIEGKN